VIDALSEIGIALVVMTPLPGTFLDGAAMVRSDGTPQLSVSRFATIGSKIFGSP
jgi:hypothetical protein